MRTFNVCSVVAVILCCACQGSVSHKKPIDEVRNGLLPPTLIAGEAPMRLEDRARYHRVPGLSIAVIEDFEVTWVDHFGVVRADDPVPVSDSTLFSVGSLSKAVTAVTVLSLVDDGLIDLDRDVNEQLRSWRVPDNELTADEAVTPRRLLNHTGGIMFSPPSSYSGDRLPSALQLLEGVEPSMTGPVLVDKVPGTVFQYSNAGFTILRLLIEERTGRPFAEVVSERIFEPLGMVHSSFDAPLPARLINDAASGHGRDGSSASEGQRWLSHTAAGGLWTTAADYAAFVVEVQRALAGRSTRVLSKKLASEMVSPQDSDRYGLGVFLHQRTGKKDYFSHIGDGLGFVGGFAAHRSNGKAAVVLSNGVGGIHLVREVMAAVARFNEWPDYLPPELQPVALGDGDLDRLVGRYRSGFDGLVEMRREEDVLWLRGVTRDDVRLFAVGGDVLVCRERAGDLRIVRGPDGSVESLNNGLADEVGRLPDPPVPAQRMADGELTPREMLTSGARLEGIGRYRALFAADPDHPAVSEGALNQLGYALLSSDALAAVAVFELNAELRPSSANCHDSLGEGYLKAGETDRAAASYRRSLELNPGNDNARRVLARLASSG